MQSTNPALLTDFFRHALVGTALAWGLALAAPAQAQIKGLEIIAPANPGGGWDTTGRALGRALQDAGVASSVTFENKGGAAGALGLAQFVNASKGDGNAMLVMGALGGALWAMIPALCKTKFGANEILTSLMLVYVADLIMDYLVRGPWRDPWGSCG